MIFCLNATLSVTLPVPGGNTDNWGTVLNTAINDIVTEVNTNKLDVSTFNSHVSGASNTHNIDDIVNNAILTGDYTNVAELLTAIVGSGNTNSGFKSLLDLRNHIAGTSGKHDSEDITSQFAESVGVGTTLNDMIGAMLGSSSTAEWYTLQLVKSKIDALESGEVHQVSIEFTADGTTETITEAEVIVAAGLSASEHVNPQLTAMLMPDDGSNSYTPTLSGLSWTYETTNVTGGHYNNLNQFNLSGLTDTKEYVLVINFRLADLIVSTSGT